MRYLALVVAIGCSSPPVKQPEPPPNAWQRMVQAYESAKTYSDHGVVTIEVVSGRDSAREQIAFETGYVQNDRFRMALTFDMDPKKTVEVWSDTTHTYVKSFDADAIVDFGPDLIGALRSLSSGSAELTTTVPFALLDQLKPTATLASHTDARGNVVLAATVAGDDIEWTLDRATFVVRGVERVRHAKRVTTKADVVIKTTITYEPVLGGAVAEAMLKPPGLTLPIEPFGPPVWIGIMTDPTSTRVQQVVPGAPAATAGVQIGDEVVSIDGHPVTNGKEVVATAHQLHADRKSPMVVKRNGAEVSLTVVAKPRPDAEEVQAKYVGNPAPAFSVASIDGATIDLASLAGHVVVIDFWATWCKPCAITTPHLDELAKQHPDLRVVGISDEDPADVRAFLAKHPVGFSQALDTGDKATRDYLIQGLPTLYVIDKAGVVRYTAVGVPPFGELDAAIAKLL
jgi:thiol-disulfide isomerase/thioredoxin